MDYKLDQGVNVFVSDISDGPMNLSETKNINKFLKKKNVTSDLALAQQVHSNKVLPAKPSGVAQGADGLFTTSELTLGIRTADCIPVIISNKSDNYLAALHCGRKGLLAGIIEKLQQTQADFSGAKVFIGPHIRINNYPIFDADAKSAKELGFGGYLKKIDNKYHFDLTSACFDQLEHIGVKKSNICDCGIDTYSDASYYSYRADGSEDVKVFITIAENKI